MRISQRTPIIFAGASIKTVSPPILDKVQILPPIKAGDLDNLSVPFGTPIVIIDGLFGANEAVTPTECRGALKAGYCLIGAGSMGALRSADLWPEGMLGVGDVYNGFRIGLLRSDADVAAAINPFDFSEQSVTNVFIRAALAHLVQSNLIGVTEARLALRKLEGIYYMDRDLQRCLQVMTCFNVLNGGALYHFEAFLSSDLNNPKCKDAAMAIDLTLARVWTTPFSTCNLNGNVLTKYNTNENIRVSRTFSRLKCRACAEDMDATDIFCSNCSSFSHEQI